MYFMIVLIGFATQVPHSSLRLDFTQTKQEILLKSRVNKAVCVLQSITFWSMLKLFKFKDKFTDDIN